MILSYLKLTNFRNYSKISLKFNKKMNIFIGNNAQGKTNILESITILSLTKSYRNGIDPNLIKFGCEQAKIEGKVKDNDIVKNLEIKLKPGLKKIYKNKTEVIKIADYISNLNTIVFTPNDLELIKSSPNIRRSLLNIELSQLSKTYLNTYNEYNKLLKTRNEYLKILLVNNVADKSYLDILTEKLIDKAIIIYKYRKEYLDNINKYINIIYESITKEKNIIVEYIPNINIKEYEEESIRKSLKLIYKKNFYKELNNGMTLYGPHRDDFMFLLNDLDLKFFGSQGQQKIAIISFKLAEINIFKEKLKNNPVLLLDDIFSELDIKKRNRLLDYIGNDIQSIITTTDVKNISKKCLKDATIFEVKNGNVEMKVGN